MVAPATPRRAALALPNVAVADAVAHGWGEAVWTHPVDWRRAALDETPVSLAGLFPSPLRALLPDGCTCTPVSSMTVRANRDCPVHRELYA